MRWFFEIFIFVLSTWTLWGGTLSFAEEKKVGGEIKNGTWVGYLTPEGGGDAVPVTMESFLVKPDSIKEFPRLNLLFKTSLGGYFSKEYETEIFEVLDYDFDQGLLPLNDSKNEMVVNAVVYSSPKVEMEGTVYLRSAAIRGSIYLEYLTDEPEGDDTKRAIPPFIPKLSGQYEGKCGLENAVLQLETAKGLSWETPVPTTGLHHYLITGVVGIENGLCPRVNPINRPNWCVDHAFSSGSYDFYQKKLFLSGTQETEECTREGDGFVCLMRFLPKDESKPLVEETCRFRKVKEPITPFKVYPRSYHVASTPEQKTPLPPAEPPASKDLVTAAQGAFYGYLHHESTNRYQPLRLDVIATTSTENPHNPNNVFVSVSAVLSFGRNISSEYWAQQFDRRSLYLVPGYTLISGESDTFLQITEWKKGFISGTWFSRAFGKVGTFEVVKGAKLPEIPVGAQMVEGIAGRFRGAEEMGGKDYWEMKLLVPKQPHFLEKSYMIFQGNYQLFAGGASWPIKRIFRGAYDIYTGAVGWSIDDSTAGETKLVTGYFDDKKGLKLFWPNDRMWAVGIFDQTLGSYKRIQ